MARKHTLKLRELRRIRVRFAIILGGMAAVTVLLLAYLGFRAFGPQKIEYLDFISLCFYGLASLVLTVAQIAFLRHLTVGAGRRIEELTYTDDLTGLGNRRHMARFLAEEFHEAQLSKNPLSLIFLDLDDFKPVNDQHGHKAGDLILRAVSLAMKETVREVDFVGRVGGDEFVIILPDTDSQCASVVARRVADSLSAISVTVDGTVLSGITASIGISSYPANAASCRELVEDADRTMYVAKNSEKGSIVISIARPADTEARPSLRDSTEIESEIEQIVERDLTPPRHTRTQAAGKESHDG